MKKNYSEPVIKVQTIALQSMIADSIKIGREATEDAEIHDRSDLLDGLFD